jgi:hypothetical protein
MPASATNERKLKKMAVPVSIFDRSAMVSIISHTAYNDAKPNKDNTKLETNP